MTKLHCFDFALLISAISHKSALLIQFRTTCCSFIMQLLILYEMAIFFWGVHHIKVQIAAIKLKLIRIQLISDLIAGLHKSVLQRQVSLFGTVWPETVVATQPSAPSLERAHVWVLVVAPKNLINFGLEIM